MVRLLVRLALGQASCDGDQDKDMFARAEGAILVFMPGVPEITRLIQLLDQTWTEIMTGASSSLSPPRLRVLPLHGTPLPHLSYALLPTFSSHTLSCPTLLLPPLHFPLQATSPRRSSGVCLSWLGEASS